MFLNVQEKLEIKLSFKGNMNMNGKSKLLKQNAGFMHTNAPALFSIESM